MMQEFRFSINTWIWRKKNKNIYITREKWRFQVYRVFKARFRKNTKMIGAIISKIKIIIFKEKKKLKYLVINECDGVNSN